MLLGIVTVGFLTGTYAGALSPILRKRWGFALHDLWQGTWYSLVSEVWFTRYPFMFWGILAFVILSIGVYEWRAGTVGVYFPKSSVCDRFSGQRMH